MAKPFIKPIISPLEAARKVKRGSSLMVGGFNYGGVPYTIIDALAELRTRDIDLVCVDTSYCNDKAKEPVGAAKLVAGGQLRSLIASYIGLNKLTQKLLVEGKLKVELMPMGTYAERIRAGGAGLGGVLTPAGVGTEYERGKATMEIDGRKYIVEPAIRADVAFIKAHKADEAGNLVYYGTNRNFNPAMATAADYVAAEVDEIVPIGSIDPDNVVTPGIFIDALVMRGNGLYASRT